MTLPECPVTVDSITLELKEVKEENNSWVDPSNTDIKDIFAYTYDASTGQINALKVKIMSLDYFMTTFLAYTDNNTGTTNLDF